MISFPELKKKNPPCKNSDQMAVHAARGHITQLQDWGVLAGYQGKEDMVLRSNTHDFEKH